MIVFHVKYWQYAVLGIDTYLLTKERFYSYLSFEYATTLLNIMTLYMMFIFTEAYRYIALLYINKMGYISKVTIYSALHGFLVMVLYIIFFDASTFDYVFSITVLFAYLCVYMSKFFHSRPGKQSTKGKRIRYQRIMLHHDEVTMHLSVSELSVSKKYFSRKGGDSEESSEDYLSDFGASNVGEKENRLVMSHSISSSINGVNNRNGDRDGDDQSMRISIEENEMNDLSRTQKVTKPGSKNKDGPLLDNYIN